MPGANVICDRCGRPISLQLETRQEHDYPKARIFVCECGRVMWQTAQATQQQQQSQKKDEE